MTVLRSKIWSHVRGAKKGNGSLLTSLLERKSEATQLPDVYIFLQTSGNREQSDRPPAAGARPSRRVVDSVLRPLFGQEGLKCWNCSEGLFFDFNSVIYTSIRGVDLAEI